jgi:hypothetical protein
MKYKEQSKLRYILIKDAIEREGLGMMLRKLVRDMERVEQHIGQEVLSNETMQCMTQLDELPKPKESFISTRSRKREKLGTNFRDFLIPLIVPDKA